MNYIISVTDKNSHYSSPYISFNLRSENLVVDQVLKKLLKNVPIM